MFRLLGFCRVCRLSSGLALLTTSATMMLSACDRTSSIVGPTSAKASAGSLHSRPHTVDDQYRQVGARVPEFGGLYLGDAGPIIVLTRSEALASARAAINEVFGSKFEERYRAAAWQSVPGAYSYIALGNWRDMLTRSVLRGVNGVSSTGLDQKRNRVRVGVTTDAGLLVVQAALAQLTIPSAAVIIEMEQPDRSLQGTLNDRERPAAAGYVIVSSNNVCTMGPIATVSGNFTEYFLTASHCTAVQAFDDGGSTYQPFVSTANFIGQEFRDTHEHPEDCLVTVCIYADAALVQCESVSFCNFTQIARTLFPAGPGQGSGSLELDPQQPSFEIFNVEGYHGSAPPMVNDRIDKVGATTGWTYGDVLDTCRNTAVGANKMLLCQVRVRALAGEGDSGAPAWGGSGLFGIVPLFHGIVASGNQSGTEYSYSPMTAIYQELFIDRESLYFCSC